MNHESLKLLNNSGKKKFPQISSSSCSLGFCEIICKIHEDCLAESEFPMPKKFAFKKGIYHILLFP